MSADNVREIESSSLSDGPLAKPRRRRKARGQCLSYILNYFNSSLIDFDFLDVEDEDETNDWHPKRPRRPIASANTVKEMFVHGFLQCFIDKGSILLV